MTDKVYRIWNKIDEHYIASNRRMTWDHRGPAQAYLNEKVRHFGFGSDSLELHEFALTRQPQPLSEIL